MDEPIAPADLCPISGPIHVAALSAQSCLVRNPGRQTDQLKRLGFVEASGDDLKFDFGGSGPMAPLVSLMIDLITLGIPFAESSAGFLRALKVRGYPIGNFWQIDRSRSGQWKLRCA